MLIPLLPSQPFPASCLACGSVRIVRRESVRLDRPACPECGYVGWREAASRELRPVAGGARPPALRRRFAEAVLTLR